MKTITYKGFTIKRRQTPIEWIEEKLVGEMGIVTQQEYVSKLGDNTVSRSYLEFLIGCAKTIEDDYKEYWEVLFDDEEPIGFNTLEYAKKQIDYWTK